MGHFQLYRCGIGDFDFFVAGQLSDSLATCRFFTRQLRSLRATLAASFVALKLYRNGALVCFWHVVSWSKVPP